MVVDSTHQSSHSSEKKEDSLSTDSFNDMDAGHQAPQQPLQWASSLTALALSITEVHRKEGWAFVLTAPCSFPQPPNKPLDHQRSTYYASLPCSAFQLGWSMGNTCRRLKGRKTEKNQYLFLWLPSTSCGLRVAKFLYPGPQLLWGTSLPRLWLLLASSNCPLALPIKA